MNKNAINTKTSYTSPRGDTVSVGDIVYTGHRYYKNYDWDTATGDKIENEIGFVSAIRRDYGTRWRIEVQPFESNRAGYSNPPIVSSYACNYNRNSYCIRPFDPNATEEEE